MQASFLPSSSVALVRSAHAAQAPAVAVRAAHFYDAAPQVGAAVPTRIQLLPPSGFIGRDGRGPYFYDPAEVIAATLELGMQLPIDYEHHSLFADSDEGAKPSAGWIDPATLAYVDPSAAADPSLGGIWGDTSWTATAHSYIAGREYRYISPVYDYYPTKPGSHTGRIAYLTGAGLTNNPNLHLRSLNSRAEKSAAGGSYTPADPPATLSKHMREQLLKLLGLPADATDEQIVTATSSAAAAAAHAKAAADAVGAASTDAIVAAAQSKFSTDLAAYVPKAEHEAMSKRATDAEAALKAAKTAAHAKEVDAVIEAAKTAGKLTPAQVAHAKKLGETDLQLLKDFVESAAPVVTPGAAATGAHTQDGTGALTQAQKEMVALSGVSEAGFRASLKAVKRATK